MLDAASQASAQQQPAQPAAQAQGAAQEVFDANGKLLGVIHNGQFYPANK